MKTLCNKTDKAPSPQPLFLLWALHFCLCIWRSLPCPLTTGQLRARRTRSLGRVCRDLHNARLGGRWAGHGSRLYSPFKTQTSLGCCAPRPPQPLKDTTTLPLRGIGLPKLACSRARNPQTPHVHRRFRWHPQRSTEGVAGEGKGRGEGPTEATVQIGKGDVKATLGIHANLCRQQKLSCVPHTFDFVSANDWTTSGATYPQLGAGMSCPA